MAEETNIEWCNHTFNPWIGCTKVSPACDNCYASSWDERFTGGTRWGAGQPRTRTSVANWKLPLKWNRQAEIASNAWELFKATNQGLSDEDLKARGFIPPQRPRVFCASLADVFDNEVPVEWRKDLFALIRKTPHLDWLILTKRISNVDKMLTKAVASLPNDEKCGTGQWNHTPLAQWPWANVWLGITICNQKEADRDIPKLLKFPAAKRFLSVEPLLGQVDLNKSIGGTLWIGGQRGCNGKTDGEHNHDERCSQGIDWVIVGGESGKDARPMHPNWVLKIRNLCKQSEIPFLFKQWGEWVPRSDCYHKFEDGKSCADMDPSASRWPCIRLTEKGNNGRVLNNDRGCDAYMQRVGKKFAGRLLEGKLHDEFPN